MKYAVCTIEALARMTGRYSIFEPTPHCPPSIVLSGTGSARDIFTDIQIQKQPCGASSYVHAGFAKRAKGLLLEPRVTRFIERHDSILLGGYSLGGAVAPLAAYLLKDAAVCDVIRVYTFGAPAVGDSQFCADYSRMGLEACTYRYILSDDIVPRVNFLFSHVGQTVVLDYRGDSIVDNHMFSRYRKRVLQEEHTRTDVDRC